METWEFLMREAIRTPEMSTEERYNARQTQSKTVVEAFFAWLDTVEPAGGSNLAKAVQYHFSFFTYCIHYTDLLIKVNRQIKKITNKYSASKLTITKRPPQIEK